MGAWRAVRTAVYNFVKRGRSFNKSQTIKHMGLSSDLQVDWWAYKLLEHDCIAIKILEWCYCFSFLVTVMAKTFPRKSFCQLSTSEARKLMCYLSELELQCKHGGMMNISSQNDHSWTLPDMIRAHMHKVVYCSVNCDVQYNVAFHDNGTQRNRYRLFLESSEDSSNIQTECLCLSFRCKTEHQLTTTLLLPHQTDWCS